MLNDSCSFFLIAFRKLRIYLVLSKIMEWAVFSTVLSFVSQQPPHRSGSFRSVFRSSKDGETPDQFWKSTNWTKIIRERAHWIEKISAVSCIWQSCCSRVKSTSDTGEPLISPEITKLTERGRKGSEQGLFVRLRVSHVVIEKGEVSNLFKKGEIERCKFRV